MKKFDLITGEITNIRKNTKYYTNSKGQKETLYDIVHCVETNIYVCGLADDVLIIKDNATTSEIIELITLYNEEIAGLSMSEYGNIDSLIKMGSDFSQRQEAALKKVMFEWEKIVGFDLVLEDLKPLVSESITFDKLYVNYFDEVLAIACPHITEDQKMVIKDNGIKNTEINFDYLVRNYYNDLDLLIEMYIFFSNVA